MADLLFVMLLVALFMATAGVVRFCDRLIGADDDVVAVEAADAGDLRTAA